VKTVEIYTDGACSGNPGPGGWGAILRYGGREREISGGQAETTNNRMELAAVIHALHALKETCRVELYSGSRYIEQSVNMGWLESWSKNDWKKSDKSPAKNPDLWQELYELLQKHDVSFHWVRGHEDNELNNRCDRLAVAQAKLYGEAGQETDTAPEE